MTAPEEDELPGWLRGPVPVAARQPNPAVAGRWRRIPGPLVTCLREGCGGAVAPPWYREPGMVADDYCSPGCVPTWIRDGAPTPLDRWRRSGAVAEGGWL